MKEPVSASKTGLIPELDGVRGLAILLVLLFHFGGTPPRLVPRILSLPIQLGWSGVDLFFVLSGFLIGGILLDTKNSSNYFQSFYARRALRVFPIYLLSVFFYFHVGLPLARHFGYLQAAHNAPEAWYWLHVSNWHSAFREAVGPMARSAYDVPVLTHVWSLAVEEQFYLVWPFFVLLFDSSGLWCASCLMVIAPLCLRIAYMHNRFGSEFLYRLTPFRIDALALGCLIAMIVRNSKWRVAVAPWVRYLAATAAAAILVCVIAQRSPHNSGLAMQTAGYTCFALLYGALIFSAVANTRSIVSTQLRRPVLRTFGKYSYAMYMFHMPLAIALERIAGKVGAQMSEPEKVGLWMVVMVVGVSLSFLVSLLSWHLIERHFLKFKSRFAARPVRPDGLMAIPQIRQVSQT